MESYSSATPDDTVALNIRPQHVSMATCSQPVVLVTQFDQWQSNGHGVLSSCIYFHVWSRQHRTKHNHHTQTHTSPEQHTSQHVPTCWRHLRHRTKDPSPRSSDRHTECPKSHFTVIMLTYQGNGTTFATNPRQKVMLRTYRNCSNCSLSRWVHLQSHDHRSLNKVVSPWNVSSIPVKRFVGHPVYNRMQQKYRCYCCFLLLEAQHRTCHCSSISPQCEIGNAVKQSQAIKQNHPQAESASRSTIQWKQALAKRLKAKHNVSQSLAKLKDFLNWKW